MRHAALEKRLVTSEGTATKTTWQEPDSGLFEHQTLKPLHRICLTLRYVQEMTVPEIAQFLGLSEMQVKGHLQYARELLRKQLNRGAAI